MITCYGLYILYMCIIVLNVKCKVRYYKNKFCALLKSKQLISLIQIVQKYGFSLK